jgi:hypothetical protein
MELLRCSRYFRVGSNFERLAASKSGSFYVRKLTEPTANEIRTVAAGLRNKVPSRRSRATTRLDLWKPRGWSERVAVAVAGAAQRSHAHCGVNPASLAAARMLS